jgi:hypothetical protein
VFAAISGSSIVTMLAIGSVMFPAMRQAGYDIKFTLGAIMSGGTLGIIIPPSIPMIIYGLVTETSIVDLFAAGFGPGILLTVVLSAYAVWFNRKRPAESFSLDEFVTAFGRGIWALLMPVIMLGGIYSGFFTATEAAAVALAYAMVIEIFVHRELKFRDFYNVVLEASKLGGFAVPRAGRCAQPQHHPDRASHPAGHGGPHAGLYRQPDRLHGADQHPAPHRGLPDDHGRGHPGAGALARARRRRLRLRQGDLRPDHDPEPRDRLSDAAGRAQPDRGHERLQQPFGLLCRAAIPFILLMLGCLIMVVWQPWIAMYFVTGKF